MREPMTDFRSEVQKEAKAMEVRRNMSAISKGRKKPRWFYQGDVNLEYGGFFYNLDNWPYYVHAWRVTPCSDAGGPENQFWLEELTVNVDPKMGDGRVEQALKSCDWVDESKSWTPAERRHRVTSAMLHYGYFDVSSRITLQVGPKDVFFDWNQREWTAIGIDRRLPAGTDLKKWLRRNLAGL